METVETGKRLGVSRTAVVVAVVVGLASFATAAIGDETPSQVTISLDGVADADAGHSGTFTASPPLCPSGQWRGDAEDHRVFTCADGSGTFHASFPGEPTERDGGSAPWQIDAGTGRYTNLRGAGNGTAVVITPGATPTFHDGWQGIVAFDSTPPSITSLATRTSRINRVLAIRLTISVRDNVADNPVAYTVSLFDNYRQLGKDQTGTSTTHLVRALFHATLPPATKTLRVVIEAKDPVGNEKLFIRRIRTR